MLSIADKVSLIFMPFGHLRFPSLGISLLKSILRENGLNSNIHYFNSDWVQGYMTGPMQRRLEIFNSLGSNSSAYSVAEACFAHLLFPSQADRHRELIRTIQDRDIRTQLEYGMENANHFLVHCLNSFSWQDVEIAGFSSSFNQNLASLALAKRLKEHFPHITIVFGGANSETVMGEQLCRSFPFVDYAFSGDADISFLEFANGILSGRINKDLPGLIFRDSEGVIHRNQESMFMNLDELPYPDYIDFFQQCERAEIINSSNSNDGRKIPFESSRGCWWGEKHHCTFCGLNGTSMKFRSKSGDRLIKEIMYLKNKYNAKKLCAMDNIIDHRYLKTVLPKVRDLNLDIEFSYEVKSNLTPADIRVLAASGIRELEAGIESLSTPSLKRMKKGVTALQNIQTLRLARQHGLSVTWRQLSGFPGEQWVDYSHLPKLIPNLFHLQAPCRDTAIEIETHRYSPLYLAAMDQTPRSIQPNPVYGQLYDLNDDALNNLAYKFYSTPSTGQITVSQNLNEFVNPLLKFWQKRDDEGADLAIFYSNSGALVIDTRTALTKIYQLATEHATLMLYCDSIRGLSSIESYSTTRESNVRHRSIEKNLWDRALKQLSKSSFPITLIADSKDKQCNSHRLEKLIGFGLIAREGQRVLSLAIEREDGILKSCLANLGQSH